MIPWYTTYWGEMPIKSISKKKLARMENNYEYQNHFANYSSLAMSMFAWDNLPGGCDERFLERSFFLYGKGMIAEYNGDLISPAAANGAEFSMYGYSTKCWGWGLNGFNHEFNAYVPGADDAIITATTASGMAGYDKPNAVIGFDNMEAYPPVCYVNAASIRLADLIRATDVAVQNLKSPYYITCEQQQVNSVKEAIDNKDNNMAAIIASNMSISAESFKVWPISMHHETLTTFWTQYRNIEGILLEQLGINTAANSDKRERLLVDEVNSNRDRTMDNLIKRLQQRELFAERCNRLFGTDISVHVRRSDYDGIDDTFGVYGSERNKGNVPEQQY